MFCAIAPNVLLNAQHDSAIERIESSVRLSAMVIDSVTRRAEAVMRAPGDASALDDGDLRRFDAAARAVNAGPGAWIILYDAAAQQLVNTRHVIGKDALPVRPDPEQITHLLDTGKANVSGMRWGSELKNNFVMFEVPVVTHSGKRHVIGQAFSPEFFARSLAGTGIPATWRVQVLDSTGTVIARSKRAEEFVGRRATPDMLEAVKSMPSGVLRHFARESVEVYDVHSRIAVAGAPAGRDARRHGGDRRRRQRPGRYGDGVAAVAGRAGRGGAGNWRRIGAGAPARAADRRQRGRARDDGGAAGNAVV